MVRDRYYDQRLRNLLQSILLLGAMALLCGRTGGTAGCGIDQPCRS
jgi:hypothetical protein